MTIAAGAFLALFGAAGTWLLSKRFPNARFLRVGYALMALGGALFVAWSLTKLLVIGVAAAAVLAAGGIAGVCGALRKELRMEL